VRRVCFAFLISCSSSGSVDPANTDSALMDSSVEASADAGAGRSLGTVDGVTASACGDAPMGATCKHVNVHCPGIPDLGATIATLVPAKETATVVGLSGGGGETYYGPALNGLVSSGRYRIVLVRWDSDWEQTPDGILAAGCRPATILKWVFDNEHAASRARAFCATGHSGGSGQISYSLAHYGVGDFLDFAALSAGPPFGRIDYGCAPETYSGPPRALCSLLPDAVLPLPPAKLNPWENSTTCGSPSPDPKEIAKWARDSVVSPGAVFAYPKTPVEFFVCTEKPNGTTGGAYFYSQAITTEHAVFCFDAANDGCSGEGLGKGVMKLVSEMDVKCVPRH
jgi:hypothetical protein